MHFDLPALPYPKDALSGYLSEEAFDYHYGKHHAAYVTNLNKLLEGSPFADKSLEEIVKQAEGGLYNNAAQNWNHTFFWNCLSPSGGGTPPGAVMDAINASFGSFTDFKQQFTTAASTLFGSGWTWLAKTPAGKLEILPMSNAGTPLREGRTPVLTLDVWEHAYYIDYRNARPKFIEGFWDVVNWDHVARAMGG